MRITFLIIMFIWISPFCHSQFGEQLIISEEAMWARSVFTADVDGDGDLDVFSASEHDNKIAWYENLDGLGSFGPQNIITSTLDASVDVFAVDLDGDEDIDVIAAAKGVSQYESKVVWFENQDGQGAFGNEIIISTDIQGALAVYAADLDGDLDMDVLSASFVDNTVSWFENTDGMGTFGAQQIITDSAWSTRDVMAVDLNGDEDLDILTVSTGGDEVIWFENLDGLGTFGVAQIVNDNTDGALSVFAADLDGDNDLDVISNSPALGEVYWYENLDGIGNFGPENLISGSLVFPQATYAVDLDNDLDNDILIISANDDKLVWHENMNGTGSFGPENLISNEVDLGRSVYAADIDGDEFIDVLSASSVDNKIAWYKNSGIFGVQEFSTGSIVIHPNPIKDTLFISVENLSITSIEIFDLMGNKVLIFKENVTKMDLSTLSPGVFFLKVIASNKMLIRKIIKE